MKDSWRTVFISGAVVFLIICCALLYYAVQESEGRQACRRAAIYAVESGRSGPKAFEDCIEGGKRIARDSGG